MDAVAAAVGSWDGSCDAIGKVARPVVGGGAVGVGRHEHLTVDRQRRAARHRPACRLQRAQRQLGRVECAQHDRAGG
eukprot:2751400-Prymnesium_polylepis.1